jgi:hypothetical protein
MKMSDKFKDLVGKTLDFYGIDNNLFKLDDIIWEAVEDPSDGYRSYLNSIISSDTTGIFFNTSLAQVTVAEVSEYNCEGYDLIDTVDGHCWLRFGTYGLEDYYPYFVFEYFPKKITE